MNIDSITLRLIHLALEEDLGTGDITTRCVVTDDTEVSGHFIAKESGVICGLEIVRKVFHLLDERVVCNLRVKDGDEVSAGTLLAEVSGPAHAILGGERVALNFLQRLSGIATKTAQMVSLIQSTKLRIIDTRKTTPGMRVLEKYAVRTGGGFNHRMNLSDGILIKDNHIKAAGGIIPAVKAARHKAPQTLKVEVEAETLEQVQQAIDAGADIIMLDNMDVETMTKAVEVIDGRALTEASGNMDQKDLLQVARAGVDMVSIGALTHSVKALDISLKFL